MTPSQNNALRKIREDGGLMLTHFDNPDIPLYQTMRGKTIARNIAEFLIKERHVIEASPALIPGEHQQHWIAATQKEPTQ